MQWRLLPLSLIHILPEKYYKQVNEYVNGHNLRGRIVYQRYEGTEPLREFEDRTLKVDSLLRKVEYKSKCLYLDWLEAVSYTHLRLRMLTWNWND